MTSVARNVESRIFLDAFIILYVSYKLKYLQRNQTRSPAEGGWGGGGVGVINKIVSGRLVPVIQILTLRTLHPIYCRKCIVFKIWINDKTKIFFSPFLPPENASVSPFGPFYSTRWQISLAFDVLQLVKSQPFHIPEAWKRYPSRVEPPCTGHYRENPGTGLYPDVRRSI